MERFICIHGHFYQPPRENPWLEAIELQDSAYPFHDWNQRIASECYTPNAFARILGADGRIESIVNNYSRISFNFGPTLLAWLHDNEPQTYDAILAADRESRDRFGGHGSALAQVYNHVIMPLANRRDKQTQIVWGIRDFAHRFGRQPEGMWLAETAVDLETLELLVDHGIRFTILSPYQAGSVRESIHGGDHWRDVSGGHIDPSRPYLQYLPSGRTITLFFYDGPISQAVAFEKLLSSSDKFVDRLCSGFADSRSWPQLMHIATDGESYGHHHRHGEMALAGALLRIESTPGLRLTNYGEYLERHPPTSEVRVHEFTSWSCIHGVERWRGDCGCNSGRPVWRQTWRGILRQTFDCLRDRLADPTEERARGLVRDFWSARDAYIDVVLDRSAEKRERFFADHCTRELSEDESVLLLKLLEIQRQSLLMYTSCGWFFDEVSGLETVQVLQYAGRAVQLAEEVFGPGLEARLREHLAEAPSNLPDHGDGRHVYDTLVTPVMIDAEKVGAHFAVRSLFEGIESTRVGCFTIKPLKYTNREAGKSKLVAGVIRVTSEITQECAVLQVAAVHFGDHNVSAGVRACAEDDDFSNVMDELTTTFSRANFPETIRVMDRYLGSSSYSFGSLFRDEKRRILKRVLQASQTEVEETYRRLYEHNLPTMHFLTDLDAPIPRHLQATAQLILDKDLRWTLKDDDLPVDQIRRWLRDAAAWEIPLDIPGLSYRLKDTLGRIAERFAEFPMETARLEAVHEVAALAIGEPFKIDPWIAQNVCWRLMRQAVPDVLDRARAGDPAARDWLERFLTLADLLGMRVSPLRQTCEQIKSRPGPNDVMNTILKRHYLPRATYRLQFNSQFTFDNARAITAYLRDLGISDVYASPILKARPGSMHGYDICDHSQINPELGGESHFETFSAELTAANMGLILDIVPNHMGISHSSNAWWMDVLENGPGSIYSSYFDIDWSPVNPHLKDKILLPCLGDQYGTILEGGHMRLSYDAGAFFIHYYETKLPVAPRTYPLVLEDVFKRAEDALTHQHDSVLELRSILTALGYLPQRTTLSPERRAERNREKEIIKRRIASLVNSSHEIRVALDETVTLFNGHVGDRHSFDRLDQLLEQQAYRPAYWRVATEEINYRRFFDINELAAIRTEVPEVFHATHDLIFRLLAAGKVHGLRVDHPDGLWDPSDYFFRLQENYLTHRIRTDLGPGADTVNLEAIVAERMQALTSNKSDRDQWPLYIVAEKILGENEPLPQQWAVHGTSGYDFLNLVNGLFVNQAAAARFTELYDRFIEHRLDFNEMIISSQRMILRMSMSSELNSLGHELDRISERNRRYRDFTLNSLTLAVREVIACLFIYRTYITGPERVDVRDRRFILEAIDTAKRENPRFAEAVFDFVRDTLLLDNLSEFRVEDRPRVIDWVMQFQQLTGPVIAKALEDTSFYVYNRLTSLNEVGGHTSVFGISLSTFHERNCERRDIWPHSMLASSTHDTKRSEDIRARINVLSELPDEWEAAITRWRDLNRDKKTTVEERPAPDANDEYLLYQTLIGAWPLSFAESTLADFRVRIRHYMEKATKEAKIHSSWINPNAQYDTAMREFINRILPDDANDPFLSDFAEFQKRIAFFGIFNSLSQLVLKLTCPGVPDIYQGNELWDFSLVDPDNRRAVDFPRRCQMLTELRRRAETDVGQLCQEMIESKEDGRIKLYTTLRTLELRRDLSDLFQFGDYRILKVSGQHAEHVCAYARCYRGRAVVVIVPVLIAGLAASRQQPPLGSDVWTDTCVQVPRDLGDRFRNRFTEEVTSRDKDVAEFRMADVFRSFPVVILESQQ